MNTKVSKKQIDIEDFSKKSKEFILKMVSINNSYLDPEKTPHEILLSNMAGAMFEELHIVKSKKHERECLTDWGAIFWHYRYALKEILVLLGNPKVNKLLKGHLRTGISTYISKLVNFFELIENNKSITAALDLYFIENIFTEEYIEKVKIVLKNYDFEQREFYNGFWKRYCYPPKKELEVVEKKFWEYNCPSFKKLMEDVQE